MLYLKYAHRSIRSLLLSDAPRPSAYRSKNNGGPMRKSVCSEMVTTSALIVVAAFMGAFLLWASDASAQGKGDSAERADTSGALEEIVVTATRREESVRDVPQAVSVLTGD